MDFYEDCPCRNTCPPPMPPDWNRIEIPTKVSGGDKSPLSQYVPLGLCPDAICKGSQRQKGAYATTPRQIRYSLSDEWELQHLCRETASVLEAVQNVNFRLGIQTKVHFWLASYQRFLLFLFYVVNDMRWKFIFVQVGCISVWPPTWKLNIELILIR